MQFCCEIKIFALVILLFSFAVNIQILILAYLQVKRLLVFITGISLILIGACCPLCAGMLRILYDKDKLDNFARVNNSIMPNVKWYMNSQVMVHFLLKG